MKQSRINDQLAEPVQAPSQIFIMLIFLRDWTECLHVCHIDGSSSGKDMIHLISSHLSLPQSTFYARTNFCSFSSLRSLSDLGVHENDTIDVILRVAGGIDFQHREGSRIGSGGPMSENQAADHRKERLRRLALEMIDLSKDPYFMRNHLGKYECRLCLTLHNTEGNYLAHTQGKRHQSNIARRAAMDSQVGNVRPMAPTANPQPLPVGTITGGILKLSRPGYKVTKSRDLYTKQRCLIFELEYPDVESGYQPRHRIMSSFEQRVETPDKRYQYIIFACPPYENIAFKIPNVPIDRSEGRFSSTWDEAVKKMTVQIFFMEAEQIEYMNRKQEMAAKAAPKPMIQYTGYA